ncbi:MAG: 1-phosphofructokinase family hexose kinase, partial [Nocardioidaceae bacterium]
MILTVTLNACLDVTYGLPRLRLGETCRVRTHTERAGGKGVNVARVLRGLGRDVTATGLVGTGSGFAAELGMAGIADAMVVVDGSARRTVTLAEEDGRTTVLAERGPSVPDARWRALLETYDGLLDAAELVVLSGSVPPGLPDDAYAVLIRRAKERGRATVLDTSGDWLRGAAPAGPDLLTPNRAELGDLTRQDVAGVEAV